MEDPPSPPTEDDEASIPPTEHDVPTGPNLNQYPTITVRRKAAKRTFPYDLKIGETIQLALPRPQDEESPARKRQRLEESFPTSADDAITENTSHATTAELPPPDTVTATAATDHADDLSDDLADLDPGMDYSIDPTTARTGKWTADEDKQLRNAVPAQGVKNWKEIASLVPGRTKEQCHNRWHTKLNFSIDATTARTGKWTIDEDKKLKDGVREHGGKNWKAIALLVPGRTDQQCVKRWSDALDPSIGRATASKGKWTADEDKQLKDAFRAHGGKNWEEIAALVPDRTKIQCANRWHNILDPGIGRATARAGRWTADEVKKLNDAVPAQGAKNWAKIATLVPGRTQKQCRGRWSGFSVCNIHPVTARKGKWTANEDKQLKDAVREHSGKNWKAIALLVPTRTKKQCIKRWCDTLDPSTGRATARAGNWTEDEDKKLKNAVPAQGDKNWKEIAALVPGRTKSQCYDRWHAFSNIDPTTARTGKWIADEDTKLREAVGAHGGKNWEDIALLVPSRTKKQCRGRWNDTLKPSFDPAMARTGKWTADEDKKLKDAVPAQGAKNWNDIALLVPGRMLKQCRKKWRDTLDPSISRATARAVKWTADEDKK
jgi:hypothetical protein